MNDLEEFIGTKIICAKPMSRLDYNIFRGWELPTNENGSDEGYLVEYTDGGKPNTKEYQGYVSWSPKVQFENAYKQSGNLSFGDAITYLKLGYKVARTGWNGKGLTLSLKLPEEGVNDMTLPYIYMTYSSTPASDTAPENHINARVPWLASQTDMLAEDWCLVD